MLISTIGVGNKFNRLTVIEDLGCFIKEGTKSKKHYYKCMCECGNIVIIEYFNLKNGKSKSCGCLKIESSRLTGLNSKKYNEYYTLGNITFVKYSNCNEYFICDTDDWEVLKRYCWHKNNAGYTFTKYDNGKQQSFHRLVTNCPDGLVPNHIYPISSGVCDNRKSNLEVVTQAENTRRKKVMPKNNTSGYLGVFWHKEKRKWQASIVVDSKNIYLGRYDNIEDAVKARRKAELKYWGEYSPLNTINTLDKTQ